MRKRAVNICLPVSRECVNPDSYGLICVRCGACGRAFDGDMSERDKAIIDWHLREMEAEVEGRANGEGSQG